MTQQCELGKARFSFGNDLVQADEFKSVVDVASGVSELKTVIEQADIDNCKIELLELTRRLTPLIKLSAKHVLTVPSCGLGVDVVACDVDAVWLLKVAESPTPWRRKQPTCCSTKSGSSKGNEGVLRRWPSRPSRTPRRRASWRRA